MQISGDAEHLRLRRVASGHVPSDDVVARRAAEVRGDLERCMNHLQPRVSPVRLAGAAERIARHEPGAHERVGGWPR